ncbi:MAG: serine/threonine protein kinase [Planctomycetes bacterium]|nr:serine/threonine protein kinase [Planctomycetota bacterium]
MWQWLSAWFEKRKFKRDHPQAHMTFGKTSLGHRLKQTGLAFRKQLWVWTTLAVLLLAGIGFWIMHSIQITMENNLRSELETVLNLQRVLVEKWLTRQEATAMTLANDQEIRTLIGRLVEDSSVTDIEGMERVSKDPLVSVRSQIAKTLGPTMSIHEYSGFVVTDRTNQILAASQPELVGRKYEQAETMLKKVFAGEATVCPPFPSMVPIADERGRIQTGTTTMFVSVPIRDNDLQVVAALSLRIQPEREFTLLMHEGRMGKTGESYAFNREGSMLTNSRFESDLILLGLIPDREDTTSILNLQVRDPGGNMLLGYRPKMRRAQMPLTKALASAVSGQDGVDLYGYRDYRGAPVVSAWTWLDDYQFGLITEIDYDEAFEPLTILKRAFYALFILLSLTTLAIFVFTLVVARLQREAREAAIEARQLGQYRLEELLGEGAMGIVYRGYHAMMRRPAAVKLLHTQRVNEASIARFEQEVQITCQLNNPHTVAIYDYGRTPEGVFYYAMEFLDGIDLQALVNRYGPQPDGRVAWIIDQLCGSLFEAHSMGLVHRDIKPANIMLNRRGGEPDFVKLLDFGLVRAVDDSKRSGVNDGMAGTPLYMSPESIQTPDMVDARSDLYAVGAVGYFLLTGEPVFEAKNLAELCQQHIDAVPLTPSQRTGRPVDPDLEHTILACLEKNRAKRPQTARELAARLHKLINTDAWSLSDADAWWSRHERDANTRHTSRTPLSQTASSVSQIKAPSTKTLPFEQTIVLNNDQKGVSSTGEDNATKGPGSDTN